MQEVLLSSKSGKFGCKNDGTGGGGRNNIVSGGGPKSQQSPRQPILRNCLNTNQKKVFPKHNVITSQCIRKAKIPRCQIFMVKLYDDVEGVQHPLENRLIFGFL